MLKEISPEYPGRTDAEAETLVLWPPDAKNWLTGSSSKLHEDLCLHFNHSSVQFSSVAQSCSLQPHGLQHARLPCPSPTPGACSNLCPLNRWCHPTISSSVVPFSSHLQSFPASGSFKMSQLFASGGQSIGVSASTSVLPVNIQDWFPLGLIDWFDLLAVQGILKSLL